MQASFSPGEMRQEVAAHFGVVSKSPVVRAMKRGFPILLVCRILTYSLGHFSRETWTLRYFKI